MRSITTFCIQYAHRFYGFNGEAQYLHGHTGTLTIEVEDTINPGVNMVFPCNEIKKTAWAVLQNFDHALILREDDPLLPAVLDVYEKQGIKGGHPQNTMKGEAFKTEYCNYLPVKFLLIASHQLNGTYHSYRKINRKLKKEQNLPVTGCCIFTVAINVEHEFIEYINCQHCELDQNQPHGRYSQNMRMLYTFPKHP